MGGCGGSRNADECPLLHYPGNKIIARTGIAFSNQSISAHELNNHFLENQIECLVDNIPPLKCSLYFSMKEYESIKPLKFDKERLGTNYLMTYIWNFQRFHQELKDFQHFKGIFSMQEKH